MLPVEAYQRFTREVTLGTGDSSKEIMPAESGVRYFITSIIATCLVSAAQVLYIGDSSGTVKAISLAASFPAHSQAVLQLINGLPTTTGESLIVKPGAAGLSFHVVVEGFLVRYTEI